MAIVVGIEKTTLGTQLFKRLRKQLKRNLFDEIKNPNVFIFEFKEMRDKEKFNSLLLTLQSKKILTYRASLASFIIYLSDKGIEKLLKTDSW